MFIPDVTKEESCSRLRLYPKGSETEFSDDGSDDDADFIPENNENLGKKYFVPTCTAYYVPVLYNSYSIY